jgi:hypothetical protein
VTPGCFVSAVVQIGSIVENHARRIAAGMIAATRISALDTE